MRLIDGQPPLVVGNSWLLALAAVLVFCQIVWWPPGPPALATHSIGTAISGKSGDLHVRATPPLRPPPAAQPAPRLSNEQSRYYDPGLAAIADGLDARSRYFVAMALEECYALSHRGLAQSRHDFAQRLGADPTVSASADNWTRHRAFDATVRHCVAFDGLPISPDRVLDLLQSAARDGDPRAVARTLLFRDLADSKEGTFDLITRVLSTGDPHTIRDVGLYLTRGESVMFIGDPAIPISATALAIAWELVACDFGLDCSSEGKILNNLCAYEGQCGAHSYEDWLSRHAHSRDELDQILRARLLLRQGLMFHDWQLLGLTGLHPQSRDQTN